MTMQDEREERLLEVANMVFIDIETSGLDRFGYKVLEIAWCKGFGEVKSLLTVDAYNRSTYTSGDPRAFEINKWFERWAEPVEGYEEVPVTRDGGKIFLPQWSDTFINTFDEFVDEVSLDRPTIVGANAAHFDLPFIEDLTQMTFPHHHRVFDMGSYAAGKLGHTKPLSLSYIRGYFNGQRAGYDLPPIPEGDHTAAGDVHVQRLLTLALLDLQTSPQFEGLLADIS